LTNFTQIINGKFQTAGATPGECEGCNKRAEQCMVIEYSAQLIIININIIN